MPKRFLTIKEAARIASVHPNTIRRWMETGILNRYKAGIKLVRVKREELMAAIQKEETYGQEEDV